MKHIHKLAALFDCGISTFTLLPQNNYLKAIPSAEQLTRKNCRILTSCRGSEILIRRFPKGLCLSLKELQSIRGSKNELL